MAALTCREEASAGTAGGPSADSLRTGDAPHLPQGCGCKGCPSGTHFLKVTLKNLLDKLIHHLGQVLRGGRKAQQCWPKQHCLIHTQLIPIQSTEEQRIEHNLATKQQHA